MNTHDQVMQDRTDQINRVRVRLSKIRPQNPEMAALINAFKGLLDIVADDGKIFE